MSNAERVNVSEEMYTQWDKVINEIWGVLQNILPSDEMQALTSKQVQWVEEKMAEEKKWDEFANKPIEERPHINFILMARYESLTDMTKERCYYLVNNYME